LWLPRGDEDECCGGEGGVGERGAGENEGKWGCWRSVRSGSYPSPGVGSKNRGGARICLGKAEMERELIKSLARKTKSGIGRQELIWRNK